MEQKINEIAKEDREAYWLSVNGIVLQQLGIANGARMLNAVNFYPDIKKWRILDPTGEYDEIYNRYAHIFVTLTEGETKFIPGVAADIFSLELSCKDTSKWPVKYLLSAGKVEVCKNDFKEIYADTEGEYYIYMKVENEKKDN